jgi:UDP-glucose:(heptosyl)LPS alpha-1,3-glucosyltransferase
LRRTLSPKQWLISRLEDRIYRAPDIEKFIANSDMVKEDMMSCHRVPPEKVEVIHHGVDLERFHPGDRAGLRKEARAALGLNDGKVILFVGHNFRLKGLYPFIEVISILKERGLTGFRGLVVGRGKRGPFLKFAEKLNCPELILFAGPQEDMRRVYAAGDLLLQPTYFDPCSITTLEALASGLPVVTTGYNGAGELITDGQEGYRVDQPDDTKKLAHRVEELLNDERLAACSAKARKLAERFPLQRNYLRVMELCGEVARRKGRKDA